MPLDHCAERIVDTVYSLKLFPHDPVTLPLHTVVALPKQ